MTLTPETERYTRDVHKKLNLTFDILTDLQLKNAEQFRLQFALPDYLRDLYRSASRWATSSAAMAWSRQMADTVPKVREQNPPD